MRINIRKRLQRNKQKEIKRVVIVGNPNSGKTALFNRLTGLHHKIGNYPGVTVERKLGMMKGQQIILEDCPGLYSLEPHGEDERIVSELIQSWRDPRERPDAVIVVVDATNLERNIFLTLQILDWDLPTILVLNMIDLARKNGFRLDPELLRNRLNADAVIPASAKTGEGLDQVVQITTRIVKNAYRTIQNPILLKVDDRLRPLNDLVALLQKYRDKLNFSPLIDSIRLVASDTHFEDLKQLLAPNDVKTIQEVVQKSRDTFHYHGTKYQSLEVNLRYEFIEQDVLPLLGDNEESRISLSERFDSILTHPVAGMAIFSLILAFIFNAIFSWSEYPMEQIETGISWLAVQANLILPAGALKDLIINGIIGGVGNVIVFLPQIVLLVLFLGVLEDSGYMVRMSFLMDNLMSRIGLHGKSVLPLLSGFACAIPAILAARTIENQRDRRIVIMLIPLISCSARLPVYTLLIAAFIPQQTVWGIVELQGLVLLGMYFLGFFTAIVIAFLIKNIKPNKNVSHFLMELPQYRIPMLRSLWWRVYDSAKLFLLNAGSIILAMSVILWFLASYPKVDHPEQQIENSYAGQFGHMIEPVIEPLGFDWKIGVGLISSFAAREVFVSTFATIYNVGTENEDEAIIPLREAMRRDRDKEGNLMYTPLVVVSLLVFFVYAAQCMSTFAIIRRETNSWKWPLMMIVYMNILAYVAALVVFQSGMWLGLG
jgi:ferrous iron transport protein B